MADAPPLAAARLPPDVRRGQGASAAPLPLRWLTPARCRALLAALLLAGFASHLLYLIRDCPLDLSGDEAQYWDWSRDLGLSYYSKGPLVAYLIRASCAIFGDVMWAVRLPALVLAAATSLLTYWLTARLFRSERLALGAVLLTHLVPMFVAGSMLMTIDPPMYFCWAAATCLAVKAVFDRRRWAWTAIGVAVGIGFLAKYAMLLWLAGFAIFLAWDRRGRRWLRTAWPWTVPVVALLFTIPVIVWNASHDWVSLRHVAVQTGAAEAPRSGNPIGRLLEFLGGQVAALGPVLFCFMVIGVLVAMKLARGPRRSASAARAMRFLMTMGVPLLVIVGLTSLRAKVQVNWPAPAYFALMILTAWLLARGLFEPSHARGAWRAWFVGGVVVPGLLLMPLAHDFSIAYPLLARVGVTEARRVDPTARLRGWRELGSECGRQLEHLGPGAFVLCLDYQQTAETAFYTPGQPLTYCVGAYLGGTDRKRFSQYDMWASRRLDRPDLHGRNAVFVGYMSDGVRGAFERVEALPELVITQRGLRVRRFLLWRCYGFRGMRFPNDSGGEF